MSQIKLYRHSLSGHSHRVELFISLLGLDVEIIDVDLAAGAHKLATFLDKNAFGQVPVIEDGDVTLADSNAILVYLANRYDHSHYWLPKDAQATAEVQRFLSLAAGKIAFGPAAARLVNVFAANLDHNNAKAISHSTLEVLNKLLAAQDWLAAEHATIADIANYTYIAHAPEGDVSLDEYAHVRAWLKRVEALNGFIPMQSTAVGLNR